MTDASSAQQEPTFEELLDQIREVVVRLESGTLSLDESIAAYRDGTARIEQARRIIAQAELRIRQLGDEADTAS